MRRITLLILFLSVTAIGCTGTTLTLPAAITAADASPSPTPEAPAQTPIASEQVSDSGQATLSIDSFSTSATSVEESDLLLGTVLIEVS